jgi:hypothetical protein
MLIIRSPRRLKHISTPLVSRGLTAWWKLDEASGVVVYDSTGTLNGVRVNATLGETGKMGTCYRCASSPTEPHFCYVLDGLGNSPTTQMSLCFWIYPTSDTINSAVVSKWYANGTADSSYLFYLGQDAGNNKMGFSIRQGDLTRVDNYPTTTFNVNEWTYICCVADGSYIRIYKDGLEIGTPVSYNGTIVDTTANVVIGKLRMVDTIYGYNGLIDEISFYTVGLSSSEISQNYRAEQ